MLNRQRNPLRRARRGAGCPPVVAVAVLAMALSACVSSEPPPADARPVVIPAVTTQPAIPPEPVTEDVVTAVEDYWVARDQAFAAGAEAGIAFIIGNNHPLLPYTADQCREAWFDGDIPIGFTERTALLDGSVESDPGWTMVQGPLAARDLGAGLFEMVVAFTYEGEGLRVADRVANVHLQVVDGEVRQFLLCEEVDVIIAEAPATAATTPATTGGTGTTTPTSPTTGTPVAPSEPTTLPPITATPSPVAPPAPPATPTTPPQTGTRPPGSGIDFCDAGDPGAQPIAGDYFLCPDSDVTNIEGEDGGSSEP
ncbi:MAG TPA: hypothetical protein VMM13_00075 [Euzebya sp.]|nr:hypothetical protein [Euzebya sp.]